MKSSKKKITLLEKKNQLLSIDYSRRLKTEQAMTTSLTNELSAIMNVIMDKLPAKYRKMILDEVLL